MKTPWPHQRTAIDSLKNGSVLVGGTGSGKSLVAIAYYYEKVMGGLIDPPQPPTKPLDLIIITTARKRDELDWDKELVEFRLTKDKDLSPYGVSYVVDSWNNVKKYVDIKNSMFIFDEQRSVGSGSWSKALVKIAKKNQWILLSATPADRWIDLIPVFVANGFYKNRTQFIREHVEYSPYTTFPMIKGYKNTRLLMQHRDNVFVIMPFVRHTKPHIIKIPVSYDKEAVDKLNKTEWNPFRDAPVVNLPEHVHALRRIINSHPSRAEELLRIHNDCKKLIVFYNYKYELEILLSTFESVTTVAQYNGQKQEDVPLGDNWIYLVQYTSGNEAWECFTTNHMAFYSMNYSYRVVIQSMGRINRLNTPFVDLYYYQLLSDSHLDNAVMSAFKNKKKFNINNLRVKRKPRT